MIAAWYSSCTIREPLWGLILRSAEDYSALGVALHGQLGSRTVEESYEKVYWDEVGWLWREKEDKVRPVTRSRDGVQGWFVVSGACKKRARLKSTHFSRF